MSEEQPKGVIITITWYSVLDARSCPRCRRLHGFTWERQNIHRPYLLSPYDGKPVWNLDEDHSMAHGEGEYRCRCHLEIKVDFHHEEWQESGEIVKLETVLGAFK